MKSRDSLKVWHLQIDFKSFELEVSEGLSSVVEMRRGKPHRIKFPVTFLERILAFFKMVTESGTAEIPKETFHFSGGCLLLLKGMTGVLSSGYMNGELRRLISLWSFRKGINNKVGKVLGKSFSSCLLRSLGGRLRKQGGPWLTHTLSTRFILLKVD